MQLDLVVLLEIYQLVVLIVFLDFVVGLYWGQFIDMLTCTFSTRQLQPEPEKSVVGEKVGTKVKEPKEIPAEELETFQNNPTELMDQPREAIQTIDSLPDVDPATDTSNQTLFEPEKCHCDLQQKQHNANTTKSVGDPKVLPRIPDKSDLLTMKDNQPRHKAEDLAMTYQSYETDPNKLYPWSLIKEVSSTFESQTKPGIDLRLRLLEPFNPEKPDLVAGDNQFRHIPEDPQVHPQIPEKLGPKDIPAEVIPQSNEQLETNEKKPEPESLTDNLQETIYDSTINVNSEDPEPGETELHEEEEDEEDESDINSPKHIEIKVVRGVNFPEAKDSDKYYVSVRIEEWRGEICYQDKKFKSKTIRGSQPEWNQDFTIQTQHPESCLMTLKIKKSSKLGSKTSTVGFFKMAVSDLMQNENSQVSALTIQLNDEYYNPVGEACLELEMKVGDLPEVVPSPAEVKRQERKLKAHKILYQRHKAKLNAAMGSQEILLSDVPKPVSNSRKLKEFLIKYQFLHPDEGVKDREVVPSPAELKRQERKLKAHNILYQRHNDIVNAAIGSRERPSYRDVPKPVGLKRKLTD
jgi:hypothetical protein